MLCCLLVSDYRSIGVRCWCHFLPSRFSLICSVRCWSKEAFLSKIQELEWYVIFFRCFFVCVWDTWAIIILFVIFISPGALRARSSFIIYLFSEASVQNVTMMILCIRTIYIYVPVWPDIRFTYWGAINQKVIFHFSSIHRSITKHKHTQEYATTGSSKSWQLIIHSNLTLRQEYPQT